MTRIRQKREKEEIFPRTLLTRFLNLWRREEDIAKGKVSSLAEFEEENEGNRFSLLARTSDKAEFLIS